MSGAARRRVLRRVLWRVLMLAPPVLVLGTLFVGALGAVLLQSFGYAPRYGVDTFPTLRHYADLFSAPGFLGSLGWTLLYAAAPTLLGAALSLYLAVALHRRFRGRALLRALCRMPLAAPYLVGVALTVLVWSNGGLAARALYALGVIETTGEFPRLLYSRGGVGIMLVYLWKQVPFQTLLIASVLAGLDLELEAAARTLGASARQTFMQVTLPRLLPGVVAAVLVVFAFNFASFEVPFLLGGGLDTLPVAAWRAFDDPDPAARTGAAAGVVVTALFSGTALSLVLARYRRLEAQRR